MTTQSFSIAETYFRNFFFFLQICKTDLELVQVNEDIVISDPNLVHVQILFPSLI